MNDKYIIFSAVLSLRKFTMEELSRQTGVAGKTVRSILNQNERNRLLEKIAIKKENQPNIYQLRDDKVADLEEEIEKKFSDVIIRNDKSFLENESANHPLFGQKMADKLLSRDFIKAETAEKKREILDLTQSYINVAKDKIRIFPVSDAERSNLQYIEQKKNLFDSLLDLEKLVSNLPSDEITSSQNDTITEIYKVINYVNDTIDVKSVPSGVLSVNKNTLSALIDLVKFAKDIFSKNKILVREFSTNFDQLNHKLESLQGQK
jgi:DNA-directed RNA polymerase subunit H (RpoH/RPB5)